MTEPPVSHSGDGPELRPSPDFGPSLSDFVDGREVGLRVAGEPGGQLIVVSCWLTEAEFYVETPRAPCENFVGDTLSGRPTLARRSANSTERSQPTTPSSA